MGMFDNPGIRIVIFMDEGEVAQEEVKDFYQK